MSFEVPDDLYLSVTPIQVSPRSSHDDEEEQNRTLVFRVYKAVWDEFNKWKAEDCKQHLLSLQNPLPPPEVAKATSRVASTLCSNESGDVEIVYLCDTNDDIPLDVSVATVLLCKAVPLELPDKFRPHPRYESCTPSVQTIALRVGSVAHNEFDEAPFVPYANDPTFDAKGYLGQFEQFAWENLVDHDVEVIQFETLHRLHIKHGLSLDDIDAVLPTLHKSNRLVWSTR
ncbi:hypothetical protein BGW80DRAFT_755784 [Lactifluus volemus]|nr:hypothetical protein BGW80DRAFT_755784 [Lactifluus volemus]